MRQLSYFKQWLENFLYRLKEFQKLLTKVSIFYIMSAFKECRRGGC